jgi:hypothetical protein
MQCPPVPTQWPIPTAIGPYCGARTELPPASADGLGGIPHGLYHEAWIRLSRSECARGKRSGAVLPRGAVPVAPSNGRAAGSDTGKPRRRAALPPSTGPPERDKRSSLRQEVFSPLCFSLSLSLSLSGSVFLSARLAGVSFAARRDKRSWAEGAAPQRGRGGLGARRLSWGSDRRDARATRLPPSALRCSVTCAGVQPESGGCRWACRLSLPPD